MTGSPPSSVVNVVQYDYVEITANVTTAGAAVDAITGNAVTYDGATRIKIEFYSPQLFIQTNATGLAVNLYEGASDLGQVCGLYASTGTTIAELDGPGYGCRFLTPTAGSHTYKFKLSRVTGAGTVGISAGSGGAGVMVPAFLRITAA